MKSRALWVAALFACWGVSIGCIPPTPSTTPAPVSHPPTDSVDLPAGEDASLSVDGTPEQAAEAARIIDQRLQDADLGVAILHPTAALTVQVRITRPTAERTERALALAVRPGTLVFRPVAPESQKRAEAQKREQEGPDYVPSDPSFRWIEHVDPEHPDELVIEFERGLDPTDRATYDRLVAENVFRQSDLAQTEVLSGAPGEWVVGFELKVELKQPFREFTTRLLKRQLAILVDHQLMVAPVVQSPLPGAGIIPGGPGGGFSESEAQSLATVLRFEPLPAPVTVKSMGGSPPDAK